MKRIVPFILILGFTFFICANNAAAAEMEYKLSLYPAYLQTPLGMPVLLEADTNPPGGTLLWWSSEPSVATVDQKGCVTPVSPGETVITCVLADEPFGFAECGVLVVTEGKIILWDVPPEPVDLDAIITELEEEFASNPPVATEVPEVPWPDAWPEDIPRVAGKVTYAGGGFAEPTGLFVMLTIQEAGIVKAYVDELLSLGFKGNPMEYDDNFLVQLSGKGYTEVMVSYTASAQQCFLSVKK